MRGLVLAGGESSRMQTDKALLLLDGEPLYKRALNALHPFVLSSFVSLRKQSSFSSQIRADVLFDDISNIGPASALLRAYRHDPHATWIVVACDFPFVNEASVMHLIARRNHKAAVTCYSHPDATPEPLFAIWSPRALALLEENVARGIFGPSQTLKSLQVERVTPMIASHLLNTNTPAEWKEATDGLNN